MSDAKDLAYQDYLSGMKYKDIAAKHGVSLSAVKSWATRDWKKVTAKKSQPKTKKVATEEMKLQPAPRESWLEIEYEYISDTNRKPCTLEDLANKYKIPFSTISKYSMDNAWSEKRKNYIKNMKQKVTEITLELTGAEVAAVSVRHFNLSNKILDALSRALDDEDELFKHVEILRTGHGRGEFDDELTVEVLAAINNKKVVDLTKALKENQDIQRKALGILTPSEEHKIDFDNKKLALEEQKINGDNKQDDDLIAWAETVLESDDMNE